MALYYMYNPEPPLTTYVSKTFPEHHYPLEKTRHKVGDFFKTFHDEFRQEVYRLHADIRETLDKYYIDIELPGLADKEHLKLKWTSTRTLFVDAVLSRPPIEEEEPQGNNVEPASDISKSEPKDSSQQEGKKEGENSKTRNVHLTNRERCIGHVARGFDFPVDVDREGLVATLKYGLLRIVVPKQDHEKVKENKIEVQHAE